MDVRRFSHRKLGILDLDLYDYAGAYGVRFGLSKADRLRYREDSISHAVILCGVHLEEERPTRWRIENSWGEEAGNRGYFSMTDAWFSEYGYQVVIDKKLLSQEHLKVLTQTPVALPLWDIIGPSCL